MDVKSFKPDTAIPSLAGKVIVVTGGNQGIGYETVVQLSKHSPQRIYLGARSRSKFDAAISKLTARKGDAAAIEFLELDLASFASISKAAEQVLAESDRLDLLFNSAGVMGVPHGVTQDGYESHFGVNHMGHALLTKKLLPLLLKTAEAPGSDVRIINVSSAAVALAPGAKLTFDSLRNQREDYHSYRLYGQSKLANVFHAKQLAAHYPKILSIPLHPGRVDTGLLDGFFSSSRFHPWALFQRGYDLAAGKLTPEEGAYNSLWAATVRKDQVKNGEFYVPVGKEAKQKNTEDEKYAKELWDWQEKEFVAKGVA